MEFKIEELSPEDKIQAQALFKRTPAFMLGVAQLGQLPDSDLPEIAFAGRSNAGKSSLINALFNNKTIAKTSNTPGRTQQLNYFNLDNRLYLVDMPGYGYAQAPEKLVKQWQKLLLAYLQGRVNLKRVFMLIDSRHGIKKADLEIMELLDKAAVTYQIILTKCDKISEAELAKTMAAKEKELEKHAAAYIKVIATSSEKKQNLDAVREEIYSLT